MTRMRTPSLSRSSCMLGGRLASPIVFLNAGRASRAVSSASTGRASTSTRTIELSSSVREAIDQDDDLQQVLEDEQIGPLLARLGRDLPDPTGRKEYVRPELRRLRYLFDQADIDIHTIRTSLDTLASLGDTQDGFSPPASTSAPPRARLSQDSSPLAPSDPPARPAKVDQQVAEMERGIARCRALLDESPADHPKRTAWAQTIAEFRCFINNRKIQVAQKDRASVQQNLKYKLAQAPEDDPKRALWENEVDRVTNKIKMEQARLRVIKTAASAPKSDVGPPKPAPPLASSSASASDTSPSSVTDTGPTPTPASTSNSSPDHTVDPAPGPTSSNTAPKPRRVDEPTTSWADVFNQAWDEPSKSTIGITQETSSKQTSDAESVQVIPAVSSQSEPAQSNEPVTTTSPPFEEVESETKTATPILDSARETASDFATSASETVAEVQEVVAEKAEAAKESVLDAASSAKGTVEETIASVKESATEAAPETARVEAEKREQVVPAEQAEPLPIEVLVEPELAPEAEVVAQKADEQVAEVAEEKVLPAAAEAEAEVEHIHAPTSLDPILEHVREAVEEKEDKEEEAKAEEKAEQVEPVEVQEVVIEDAPTAPSPTELEVTAAAEEQPKQVEAEVEKVEVVVPEERDKKSRGWFGGMFGR